MNHHELEGVWKYVALTTEGTFRRSPESLATMAKLALLVGEYLPSWDGLWAIVAFRPAGGVWTGREVLSRCRQKILGEQTVATPRPDLYIYAGGRFRMAPHRSPPEIDLEQFSDGREMGFPTETKGIFEISGDRLTLCMAEVNQWRPSTFTCGEDASTSLGELVRCPIDGPFQAHA